MPSVKRSYILDERLDAFISKQVQSGRFNDETEVVQAGLRLLEDEEARVADLRAAISVAEAELEAGLGVQFDSAEALTAEIMRRVEGN